MGRPVREESSIKAEKRGRRILLSPSESPGIVLDVVEIAIGIRHHCPLLQNDERRIVGPPPAHGCLSYKRRDSQERKRVHDESSPLSFLDGPYEGSRNFAIREGRHGGWMIHPEDRRMTTCTSLLEMRTAFWTLLVNPPFRPKTDGPLKREFQKHPTFHWIVQGFRPIEFHGQGSRNLAGIDGPVCSGHIRNRLGFTGILFWTPDPLVPLHGVTACRETKPE